MGSFKYIITFSLVLLFVEGMKVKGQSEILLNLNDIDLFTESYSLSDQRKTFWPQSFDSLNRNTTRQKWSNSKKESFFIDYCIFDSYQDAFNASSYVSNLNSMPYIYGTPTGKLIGDASWISIDGSSLLFQKNNIGVKIFKVGKLHQNDYLTINKLANKILEKIDKNILNPNLMEQTDKQPKVKLKLNPLSHLLDEYIELSEVMTLWVSSTDSLIYGNRRNLIKDNTVIGIDLIAVSDSIEAKKISQIRSKAFNCSSFQLDDDQSLEDALDSWNRKWEKVTKMTNFSIMAYSSDKSIHFYCYDINGVDISAIKMILKEIAKNN